MTIARKEIVVEGEEGFYHCISRCVRRAFLCGLDQLTGKNFDHRKGWIEARLKFLATVFAIDVAANAIMSNHLHTILRNRPDIAESWSDEEVARRWRMLYPKGRTEKEKEAEIKVLANDGVLIQKYRLRLQSISWFMKSLNEYIARRANKEDECKGAFWEGRFKSIALADEAALLACMVYVDLNPIRAGIARTPEESDFTSIRERILGRQARARLAMNQDAPSPEDCSKNRAFLKEQELGTIDEWLSPISIDNNEQRRGLLQLSEDEYIELVDYSGRGLQDGKRGAIPDELVPILTRLEIDHQNWLTTITKFDTLFCRAAGRMKSLMETAVRSGKCWLKGFTASKAAFAA